MSASDLKFFYSVACFHFSQGRLLGPINQLSFCGSCFLYSKKSSPIPGWQRFFFWLASRFIILAFSFKHTIFFELNVISIYFYRVNINVKGARDDNRENASEATREGW